jgi:serine/threonine protein kinase
MKKLGKFEIIEKIGQGAMGVVYKARDPLIGRIVALKTLTTGLSEDPNLLMRFYSEARAAGGLQHPNIVTIYQLGHEGNTPFIVMQFLNGESLDKLIARRADVPVSQKIGFIVSVCRALDHAHRQDPPIIHRDIKPGNVMVTTEGSVMVVDFGIARLGEGSKSQSAGMLIGTFAYMAPQLFHGGTADARSDIWATGVLLYELLTHKRPFSGDTPAELISNISEQEVPAISEVVADVSPEVAVVLDRMLCKEMVGRYQSMEEVLMELEPPWHRLQQRDIANLIATSQEFMEAGQLANAQENLRQAVQIDPSSTPVKMLLEKVSTELRRKQILPELRGRVEKARELFSGGRFEDAVAEAEEIIRIDSGFQPALDLLEKTQIAVTRKHTVDEAIRGLQQKLAEGSLSDAETDLVRVLQMDPDNAIAKDLAEQIRVEKTRRELKKSREEILQRASVLFSNRQYEEGVALLVPAELHFPEDPEIVKLLDRARQEQAEQRKQVALADVQNLVGARRFEEALEALENLLDQHPGDPAATNLRSYALEGVSAVQPGSYVGTSDAIPRGTELVDSQQTAIGDAEASVEQHTAVLAASATAVTRGSSRGFGTSAQPSPPSRGVETTPPVPLPAGEGRGRNESWKTLTRWNAAQVVLATCGLLVAGVLISGAHFIQKSLRKGPATTASELALQRQSQELRSQGRFDEASDKDRQIVKLRGGLTDWAMQDLDAMQKVGQKEAGFLADARIAEQAKDYQLAQQDYRLAVALHGPQQSAAQAASDSVEAILRGAAAETVAQNSFERGVQAFNQHEYQTADDSFREALIRAPEAWPRRSQVQAYVERIESIKSQSSSLQRAQSEFGAMQYDLAKADATKSANTTDGDPDMKASAVEMLRKLRGREDQRKMYDQATRLEGRGSLQQAKNLFDRVSSVADGDRSLSDKAKNDAVRVSGAIASKAASVVKDVETAIAQGQFDAADEKLKDVPSDQSDYSRLKSAIAEGRKEDGVFAAKSVEMEKAATAKDEAGLKTIREFFAGVARSGGRHSHQAEESVSRIDQDLKASEAARIAMYSPGSKVTAADLDKINQLKADYKSGFQTKSVPSLRHIWPSLPDKKVKEYEDTFKVAESIQWNLNDCQPPAFHGETAILRCVEDIAITPHGGEQQHKTDTITFYLQRQGSDWMIARMDTKKLKH